MSAVIAILSVITVMLFYTALRRLLAPSMGQEMVATLTREGMPQRTAFDRHIRPSLAKLPPRFGFLRGLIDEEDIERQLTYAGHPLGLTPNTFFGLQLYGMLVGGGIALLLFIWKAWGYQYAVLALPLFGFFYPRLWLRGKVNTRQREIDLALPDFLDMLSISIKAGLGFDPALRHVTQRMTGPLHDEVARLLRELSMGEQRTVAFRSLLNRNKSDNLRLFVDLLLQAEELGTPVAKIIERQAEEIRVRRIQKAKELAAQASSQVSLVAVALLAPSAFCLLISAIVLTMLTGGLIPGAQ